MNMDAIRTNIIVITTPRIMRNMTRMMLHIVMTKLSLHGHGDPGWLTMLTIGVRRVRRTTIEFPVTVSVDIWFIQRAIFCARYYRYCDFMVVVIYTWKAELETD